MGNCLGRQVVPATYDMNGGEELVDGRKKEKEEEEKKDIAASTVRVKIVITRKQWEELVSNGDLQSLDAHKLLSQLVAMKTSGRNVGVEKKMWRPSLQKIAEEVSE